MKEKKKVYFPFAQSTSTLTKLPFHLCRIRWIKSGGRPESNDHFYDFVARRSESEASSHGPGHKSAWDLDIPLNASIEVGATRHNS